MSFKIKSDNVYLMIESGKPLELVKKYIMEVKRVKEQSLKIADELGITKAFTDRDTGIIQSVIFEKNIHPEFTKPHKKYGASHPKKKTEWAKRFKEQIGHRSQIKIIQEELGIPLYLAYHNKTENGSVCLGNPFNPCGFLYMGEEGPYAMYIPNVEAKVKRYIEDGYEVVEPAKSFKLNIDGCRQIEKEEWEIIVLQYDLAKKKGLVEA